jgi:hypothetical protein
MPSDLQRLMRAVRVITKVAREYDDEEVAEALMKHCSRKERGEAAFAGGFLEGMWQLNKKAESEAEPRCCECGENILDAKSTAAAEAGREERDPRADTRYCSPKCRTRAYRKRRVTNGGFNSSRKRHATKVRDASHVRNRGEAVT